MIVLTGTLAAAEKNPAMPRITNTSTRVTTEGIQAHWNTLYIGLSTATYTSSQASILSGEPTSSGSYARIVVVNNQANFPLPTAASPSVLTVTTPQNFAASTSSGWSTGASNLNSLFIADASTLAGGNVIAVGALGTPQAVASAGVTLSITSLTIAMT